MNNTAIVICSYNMVEWTDALCEHILETVKVLVPIYGDNFAERFMYEYKETEGEY